jgi:DNA repair exonuclease SbcCD ATPase subunit
VALLQEVGIYQYRHPLDDAVAYQDELAKTKRAIKTLVKDGRAVECETSWQVNGSTREGQKMARDLSKLMLRAYNAEADNIARTLKPHTLSSAIARLDKARGTISKLGRIVNMEITYDYHRWRTHELELTADYLVKVEEEKERLREERARQREEEKALREFKAEKARLTKEQAHYQTALDRLRVKGDEAGIRQVEEQLAQIESAITGIENREANIRAGYVYVISNIGSFGDHVVKIGLTRRLEPMDRVRELGDASVPFNFDVHALIFSDDAVGLVGAGAKLTH